ncbi:MAG: PcfB family protein [Ruminococcus sp.]|nr:PcfB family protein [Ruminococcus sp.]
MQEYNNEKIVALTVKVAGMDIRAFKAAISKYLSYRDKQNKPVVVHGKQSLKKLIRGNDNASVTNIEITDKNIKAFEKTAKKYDIDYSLKKDNSVEPPKYTIFFRAKDSEIMTKAFKEFLNSESRNKEKKPSILTRLNDLVRIKNKERTREKTKTREAEL